MNAALRNSSAHVFVNDLATPQLDPDDRHHLAKVLRLREGEIVSSREEPTGLRIRARLSDSATGRLADFVVAS